MRNNFNLNPLFHYLIILKKGPPHSRGTSAYLGTLPIGGSLHIPEMRAMGWSRQPDDVGRVGMVAFGVGIAEIYGPAKIVGL